MGASIDDAERLILKIEIESREEKREVAYSAVPASGVSIYSLSARRDDPALGHFTPCRWIQPLM